MTTPCPACPWPRADRPCHGLRVRRVCDLVAAGHPDGRRILASRAGEEIPPDDPARPRVPLPAPAEPAPNGFDPDIAAEAERCPWRTRVSARPKCHHRCQPGGRRPGEVVTIEDCYACVLASIDDAPMPPIVLTVDAPDRIVGVKCKSCPVAGHLCGGLWDFKFCDRPAGDITPLSQWQHSLFAAADMQSAPAPTPRAPSLDGRARVALFGPCLQGGGAEEWQRHLLISLDPDRIAVVGLGVPDGRSVLPAIRRQFERLAPVVTGGAACRRLAADADLALCWGISRLDDILPLVDRRPPVAMVCHTDTAMPWDVTVHAQRGIDHLAAVSAMALAPIPRDRHAATTIIPNAVEVGRLAVTRDAAEVRAELGIPEHAPVLGYVGRPDGRQKDPQALARALRYLPGWYGLFLGGNWFGDKSVWNECRGIAGPRAVFAGQRRDLGNYLQVMTRGFVPSRWESFCLSAAEMMAFGLPILMTDFGVAKLHPDWVAPIPAAPQPPGDDGAILAAAVLADCEGPGAIERAERAREGVRSIYSLERFGSAWTEAICGWADAAHTRAYPAHTRA